jgi:tripartite-type tricarboxylate transporter receptor subunit TctC
VQSQRPREQRLRHRDPAVTHAPIRARLEEAYRAAVRRPEIMPRLKEFGLIVVATSSADFARVLAEDAARYSEVIRAANVKLE